MPDPTPPPRCQGATPTHRLSEEIGRVYQKNGADYHTGEQVITWLNDVLGEENWSYRVIERWREQDSDECCCIVELQAVIWEHDASSEGELVRHTITKQDVGSQQIKRFSSTKLPISIGDDYKAALTDGLKRCARLLGVGLYLWAKEPQLPWRRSDEEEAARGRGQAPARARQAGPAAPAQPAAAKGTRSTGEERQRLEDRYNDVLAESTNLGFKAGFVTMDVTTMTDEQINGFGKRMREFLELHEPAEGADRQPQAVA
jgi:hypothetical protein